MALLSLQSWVSGNSHRDIEVLLTDHGITVSSEAIRLWCIKFGAIDSRGFKRGHQDCGDSGKLVAISVFLI
jgi:transposase-like protein